MDKQQWGHEHYDETWGDNENKNTRGSNDPQDKGEWGASSASTPPSGHGPITRPPPPHSTWPNEWRGHCYRRNTRSSERLARRHNGRKQNH